MRTSKWHLVRVLALLSSAALALVSGCGASNADAPSKSGGVDKAHVVIAWNSTPDESYLPLLMAVDAMKKRGYDIEEKTLSGSDVTFQSLSTNKIQFTADSLPPGALSIKQGAPIKIIGTRNANLVVWVAREQYEDCSKLNGKPVGIYSQTGGYTVEMKLYFEKHCPGVHPKYITIPNSPVRAQAVATGRIDGTALGLPDAVALERKFGKSGLKVVPLRQDLPGIGDEYVYANVPTIKSHKSIVEALLREQLKAIRDIYAHPQRASSLVKKYIPKNGSSAVVKRFAKQDIWYANGGLDGPGLPNTLKAFDLPGSPKDLQDTTLLHQVLKTIGRSDETKY